MVGYWPTMVATCDGELGFDSGEVAVEPLIDEQIGGQVWCQQLR